MPISIQVTRGLLTAHGEKTIFTRVAQALLESHGLEDNEFMKRNVIGHLLVSEISQSFVGNEVGTLALIEVKVPPVTFRERSSQESFIARVTDIVDELKAGAHPRSRTFVNVTHAVEGTWGIGGRAFTSDDLGAAMAGAEDVDTGSGARRAPSE